MKHIRHDLQGYRNIMLGRPGHGVEHTILAMEDMHDDVKTQIFVPAGMKDAGSTPKTESDARIAVGYSRIGSPGTPPALQSNWETLPWRGMSAGGGEATAHDLLAFANALTSKKLVNAELTKTITTSKIDASFGGQYGYGFTIDSRGNQRVVGHGGGANGMNADLAIYWDAGYTIIVLANLDPPVADRVSSYIQGHLQLP